MISSLLNFAAQMALLLLVVWLLLALLGVKWRLFRTARQGYGGLLKAVVVAAATWLWAPEVQRQGGGQVAQAAQGFQENEEEEEWKDSGPEGLP